MRKTTIVALAQLMLALLLSVGIWVALPARYLLVDVVGSLIAMLAAGAAVGLIAGASWSLALARVAAAFELVIGTLCVSALALSVSQLAGAYGPVGAGGALLMGTIALLVLPYLVLLPALQLYWLRATS